MHNCTLKRPSQELHARDLDTFLGVVSSSFAPVNISGDSGRLFSAHLTSADADDVVFTEISGQANQAFLPAMYPTPEGTAKSQRGDDEDLSVPPRRIVQVCMKHPL